MLRNKSFNGNHGVMEWWSGEKKLLIILFYMTPSRQYSNTPKTNGIEPK
jgi:hypothetical protein